MFLEPDMKAIRNLLDKIWKTLTKLLKIVFKLIGNNLESKVTLMILKFFRSTNYSKTTYPDLLNSLHNGCMYQGWNKLLDYLQPNQHPINQLNTKNGSQDLISSW
jgi:hypothetical protein